MVKIIKLQKGVPKNLILSFLCVFFLESCGPYYWYPLCPGGDYTKCKTICEKIELYKVSSAPDDYSDTLCYEKLSYDPCVGKGRISDEGLIDFASTYSPFQMKKRAKVVQVRCDKEGYKYAVGEKLLFDLKEGAYFLPGILSEVLKCLEQEERKMIASKMIAKERAAERKKERLRKFRQKLEAQRILVVKKYCKGWATEYVLNPFSDKGKCIRIWNMELFQIVSAHEALFKSLSTGDLYHIKFSEAININFRHFSGTGVILGQYKYTTALGLINTVPSIRILWLN